MNIIKKNYSCSVSMEGIIGTVRAILGAWGRSVRYNGIFVNYAGISVHYKGIIGHYDGITM